MKQEGHPLILLIFLKNKVQPGTKESRYKGDEKISKITQMLLHKHSQAFFKSSFPRIEADLSIIKNDIISGQPDDPANSDKSH